jgi:hypothetical protein
MEQLSGAKFTHEDVDETEIQVGQILRVLGDSQKEHSIP